MLTMKYLWFNAPTQFPIHGQWWSNLAMHLSHIEQCLDRTGFLIKHVLQNMRESKHPLVPFLRKMWHVISIDHLFSRIWCKHTTQIIFTIPFSAPFSASCTIVRICTSAVATTIPGSPFQAFKKLYHSTTDNPRNVVVVKPLTNGTI